MCNYIKNISTPIYLIDEKRLIKNLVILSDVKKRTDCKILLALKAFSGYKFFPLISKYLDGVSASSNNEAQLGYEYFGKDVHMYTPAYGNIKTSVKYSSHIIFNSFFQYEMFKKDIPTEKEIGIRVNPETSDVSTEIYNPCGLYSRFGVLEKDFDEDKLDGVSGLHFHALCEQNADSLEKVLVAFEEKFGKYCGNLKWVNFGGGHHITREDYDVNKLCELINNFKNKYDVQVYLEPGEAVVLNTGVLVASVLSIVHNKMDIAILDTSAAAHMPDILEMPYHPEIENADKIGKYKYDYRLTGATCLAGDIIGDYSFKEPLKVGSKIVLKDMAHYTMVKNNTFNGICLPSIGIIKFNGEVDILKNFSYEDYKSRL